MSTFTLAARLGGVLLAASLLTACSDDDGGDADPSTPASAPAGDPQEAGEGESAGGGEAGATLTLDGTTYEFADTGSATSFCQTLGPTLQAGLESADGDELRAFLVQDDADLSGELAEDNQPYVEATIGGVDYIAGASGLAGVVPTPPADVEISVSGTTASGSIEFTVVGSGDVVVGDLELTCG